MEKKNINKKAIKLDNKRIGDLDKKAIKLDNKRIGDLEKENKELVKKIKKLKDFLYNYCAKNDEDEYYFKKLREQLNIMESYSKILKCRINFLDSKK